MATITPVLWTQKVDSEGRSLLYIRIQAHRKRRLVSLGIKLHEDQWNAAKGRVLRHPRRDEINAIISARVSELESQVYALKHAGDAVSADRLKQVVTNPRQLAGNNFFAQARLYIDDLQAKDQVYTARRYRSVVGQFRRFAGRDLALSDITVRLLRDYENERFKRGNRPATVASHFRAIKAIYRRAERDGLTSGASPFDTFKVGNPRGERTRLTFSTIKRFATADLAEGSWPWHARNYYLFSFFCAGLRFGDLARLRWKNVLQDGDIYRLEYQTSKNERAKAVKLTAPALDVLARYGPAGGANEFVFPLLVGADLSTAEAQMRAIDSRDTQVNKNLKIAAAAAGIETPITYYSSKHSYADLARRSGASIYTISKALGHGSLKATEFYLKGFDDAGLDEHMDSLFG